MFVMLNALDERLLLSNLPSYVTDNPDNLPSTRLYEGDFSVIMKFLEKLEGKLTIFGSAMSAISRDVCTLVSKSRSVEAVARGAINNRETTTHGDS